MGQGRVLLLHADLPVRSLTLVEGSQAEGVGGGGEGQLRLLPGGLRESEQEAEEEEEPRRICPTCAGGRRGSPGRLEGGRDQGHLARMCTF